jgi:hypothetical protein
LPYSIDTSGLLDGWKRYYPPDIFPIIWDNVSDLIDAGGLIAPEEVREELRIGADDLYDWACVREQMFVPLTLEIQTAVANILAVHPQWVPADRSRNMADPFVVAVAMANDCTVVSGELWSNSPRPDRVKIPNVCNSFGIQHIQFLDMMREQGWVFAR